MTTSAGIPSPGLPSSEHLTSSDAISTLTPSSSDTTSSRVSSVGQPTDSQIRTDKINTTKEGVFSSPLPMEAFPSNLQTSRPITSSSFSSTYLSKDDPANQNLLTISSTYTHTQADPTSFESQLESDGSLEPSLFYSGLDEESFPSSGSSMTSTTLSTSSFSKTEPDFPPTDSGTNHLDKPKEEIDPQYFSRSWNRENLGSTNSPPLSTITPHSSVYRSTYEDEEYGSTDLAPSSSSTSTPATERLTSPEDYASGPPATGNENTDSFESGPTYDSTSSSKLPPSSTSSQLPLPKSELPPTTLLKTTPSESISTLPPALPISKPPPLPTASSPSVLTSPLSPTSPTTITFTSSPHPTSSISTTPLPLPASVPSTSSTSTTLTASASPLPPTPTTPTASTTSLSTSTTSSTIDTQIDKIKNALNDTTKENDPVQGLLKDAFDKLAKLAKPGTNPKVKAELQQDSSGQYDIEAYLPPSSDKTCYKINVTYQVMVDTDDGLKSVELKRTIYTNATKPEQALLAANNFAKIMTELASSDADLQGDTTSAMNEKSFSFKFNYSGDKPGLDNISFEKGKLSFKKPNNEEMEKIFHSLFHVKGNIEYTAFNKNDDREKYYHSVLANFESSSTEFEKIQKELTLKDPTSSRDQLEQLNQNNVDIENCRKSILQEEAKLDPSKNGGKEVTDDLRKNSQAFIKDKLDSIEILKEKNIKIENQIIKLNQLYSQFEGQRDQIEKLSEGRLKSKFHRKSPKVHEEMLGNLKRCNDWINKNSKFMKDLPETRATKSPGIVVKSGPVTSTGKSTPSPASSIRTPTSPSPSPKSSKPSKKSKSTKTSTTSITTPSLAAPSSAKSPTSTASVKPSSIKAIRNSKFFTQDDKDAFINALRLLKQGSLVATMPDRERVVFFQALEMSFDALSHMVKPKSSAKKSVKKEAQKILNEIKQFQVKMLNSPVLKTLKSDFEETIKILQDKPTEDVYLKEKTKFKIQFAQLRHYEKFAEKNKESFSSPPSIENGSDWNLLDERSKDIYSAKKPVTIKPSGNCLFASIHQQVSVQKKETFSEESPNIMQYRQDAINTVLANPKNYMNLIRSELADRTRAEEETEGDLSIVLENFKAKYIKDHGKEKVKSAFNSSGLRTYDDFFNLQYWAQKMGNDRVWGGQVAIEALAQHLKRPIYVFQPGQGVTEGAGTEFTTVPIYLKLEGKHYEGLVPKSPAPGGLAPSPASKPAAPLSSREPPKTSLASSRKPEPTAKPTEPTTGSSIKSAPAGKTKVPPKTTTPEPTIKSSSSPKSRFVEPTATKEELFGSESEEPSWVSKETTPKAKSVASAKSREELFVDDESLSKLPIFEDPIIVSSSPPELSEKTT